MATEHGVLVVFDTIGPNHHAAARKVSAALMAHSSLWDPAPDGRQIVSWWFPEGPIKDIDRNDNDDMTLVNRQYIQQLVDAYEQGDAEWLGNVVTQFRRQLTGHAL